MSEHRPTGGDCMCWFRGRRYRIGFGILLIVIGLLWLAQRVGWLPSGTFGPLFLLAIGLWLIATSHFHKRQALPSVHGSSLSCCGFQFRPDRNETTRKDQAAADNMLSTEGLSEQNHP